MAEPTLWIMGDKDFFTSLPYKSMSKDQFYDSSSNRRPLFALASSGSRRSSRSSTSSSTIDLTTPSRKRKESTGFCRRWRRRRGSCSKTTCLFSAFRSVSAKALESKVKRNFAPFKYFLKMLLSRTIFCPFSPTSYVKLRFTEHCLKLLVVGPPKSIWDR